MQDDSIATLTYYACRNNTTDQGGSKIGHKKVTVAIEANLVVETQKNNYNKNEVDFENHKKNYRENDNGYENEENASE